MSTKTQAVHGGASTFNLIERLLRPFTHRELLVNLVRKELRVRYKDSVLGFLWSMLNPVLYLVVFYVVFNYFLTGGIPFFPVFMLSGLLPWTLFSSSMSNGAGSIVANGPLLKKVYFPREVLPLASVGAALFHFFLQTLVLVAFLVVFRYSVDLEFLPLVPLAIIVEILLVAALSLLLSSLTVYLRDIQHFIEIALLAWFWMTPIIYPVGLVFDKLNPRGLFGYYLMNPLTTIVITMQRAFYAKVSPVVEGTRINVLLDRPVSWYLEHLGYVALAAVLLLLLGQYVFARVEGNFAEEL